MDSSSFHRIIPEKDSEFQEFQNPQGGICNQSLEKVNLTRLGTAAEFGFMVVDRS
jgi:hypothetical protein